MTRRKFLKWAGATVLLIGGIMALAGFLSRLPVPVRVFQISRSNAGFYGGVLELSDGTIVVSDYFHVYGIDSDGNEDWRIDFAQPDLRYTHDTGKLAVWRNTVFVGYRGLAPRTNVIAGFENGEQVWEHIDSAVSGFGSWDGPANNVNDTGIYFMNRSNVVALDSNGSVRWTRPTFGRLYSSPVVALNGDILFRDTTNKFGIYWMKRLKSDGTKRWQKASDPDFTRPTFAPDGTFYRGRGTNITLAAFSPDGEEQWRLARPERALSSPVVGPDGTICFTARSSDKNSLMSVSPEGKINWVFPLGWGYSLTAPVIDVNGMIYLVTSDRLVRAITPEGKLKWQYRIPAKLKFKKPPSWNHFTRQFRERFGLKKNELFGMPLISSDGILYVNFHHTGCLYAFDIRESEH